MLSIKISDKNHSICKTVNNDKGIYLISSNINSQNDFLIDKFIIGASFFDEEINITVQNINNKFLLIKVPTNLSGFISIDNKNILSNRKVKIGSTIKVFNSEMTINVSNKNISNSSDNYLKSIIYEPSYISQDASIIKPNNYYTFKKIKRNKIVIVSVLLWAYCAFCFSFFHS